MYYCANVACPAQAQQRIEHFASRGAMDIRGIGENLSAMLFEKGLVKDIADLYSLKDRRDELIVLEKLGEKSTDKILAAIEKSQKRPLGRIIFALGIRHVGSETAEILADEFRTIDALAQATADELEEIPTIGPRIAESIIAFFQQDDNQDILRRLQNAGVFPDAPATTKPSGLLLSGKEFVVTGKLESFSRQEAEGKIKELGGATKGNVTRNTDYVVAGTDPGSKRDRAVELGIPVINEKKFLEMLDKDK